ARATRDAPAAAEHAAALHAPDTEQLWGSLVAQISDCRGCALHQTRTRTVPGIGDRKAGLLVIGEAPGADEDRQGEPFVGRAGKLLTNMLRAIGLEREQVYITNILKCRPPGNRDPRPDEAAACRGYLERQMDLLAPRLVLVVGRIAAQQLLQTDQPIGAMRGSVVQLPGRDIPVVVTYHPAYLLRSPEQKAKAWRDLQLVARLYNSTA
ncbi:MAG TPA: uracil-DNA glycosylase, partial [Gammaproteobacteria bacterium]|nr:uracil-DNA glycosylase [Gammaproteobacteria bacterium]MCH78229.1 uracil-DNA glycosylase [Gammaproteobacteria bacterium]